MRERIRADEPFVREDVPVAEALDRFRAEGQDYKVDLIEDLVRDASIETVSLYANGPFTDLAADRMRKHRAHRRREAAVAGRRLLARRRATVRCSRVCTGPPSSSSRSSTSTSTASSRRAPATTACPGARALRLLRGRAGRGLLDAARRHRLQRARAPQPRDVRDPRLPRGQRRPSSTTLSCGGPRATGSARATCSSRRPRAGRSGSSR